MQVQSAPEVRRATAARKRGGKSGPRRAGCRLTAGRSKPCESAAQGDGKWNRKHTADGRKDQARLKWCASGRAATPGKSPPRARQRARHAKPHPGQGQIGKPWRGSRRFRVGCLSGVATRRPDEWLPVRSRTTEPGLQADFHSFLSVASPECTPQPYIPLPFGPTSPHRGHSVPQLLSKHIQFIFYPIKNKRFLIGMA